MMFKKSRFCVKNDNFIYLYFKFIIRKFSVKDMKFKFKNIKASSVVSEGLSLEEIIDKDFLTTLKEKFKKRDLRIAELKIVFPIKEIKSSKKKSLKEGDTIAFMPIDFIKLYHRGEKDYFEKVLVIESNNEKILEDFLNEQ